MSGSGCAVCVGVVFRRFFGVVFGVNGVTVGNVSVVGCFFVIAGLVMPGGFVVVRGRVPVVFGGSLVMFGCLMTCHSLLLRD